MKTIGNRGRRLGAGAMAGLLVLAAFGSAAAQKPPRVPRESTNKQVVISGPRSTDGGELPLVCSTTRPGQSGTDARCLNPQPLPPREPVPVPSEPR